MRQPDTPLLSGFACPLLHVRLDGTLADPLRSSRVRTGPVVDAFTGRPRRGTAARRVRD